jgi:hypothetical protein
MENGVENDGFCINEPPLNVGLFLISDNFANIISHKNSPNVGIFPFFNVDIRENSKRFFLCAKIASAHVYLYFSFLVKTGKIR